MSFNFCNSLAETFGTVVEFIYPAGWSYAGDSQLDDGFGVSYLPDVLSLLVSLAGGDPKIAEKKDIREMAVFLTEKKGIDITRLFPVKADERGSYLTGYTPKVWLSPDGKPVILFGPKEADTETGLGPNCFEVIYKGKKDWQVGNLEGSVSSFEKGKEKTPAPKLDLTGPDGVTTIASFPIMTDMSEAIFKLEAMSVLSGSKGWDELLKPAPELGSGGEYSDSPILRDWQLVAGDYLLKKLYGPYQKEGAEWLSFMVELDQGGVRYVASVPMNESNSAQCLRGKRPIDPTSPLAEECRKQLASLNEAQSVKGKFGATTLKKAAERLEAGEDVPTWLITMAKLAMGITMTYRVKEDLLSVVKAGKSPYNKKGYPISPKVAILATQPDSNYLGGILDVHSLPESVASGLTPYLPAGKDESPETEVPY